MLVSKWGNSLAVRLPAKVIKLLSLQEGDDIEIVVHDERTFAVRRKASPKEVVARLRKFRGKLPADFHFDRGETHDR